MEEIRRKDVIGSFEKLLERVPNAEVRVQQLQLSLKIMDILNGNGYGILQAGTGVGKSFSYLIPLILSDERAVISSSTKLLASQLYNKDLKLLKETVFPSLTYAEAKGVKNYICMKRFYEYYNSSVEVAEIKKLFFPRQKFSYEEVCAIDSSKWLDPGREFENYTEMQDYINDIQFLFLVRDKYYDYVDRKISYKEFSDLPLNCSNKLINKITVERASCCNPNSKCSILKQDKCPFAFIMDDVEKSQIVVTNHAYVASSIINAVKSQRMSRMGIRSIWVADEAHDLEESLIEAFSPPISVNDIKDYIDVIFNPMVEVKLMKALSNNEAMVSFRMSSDAFKNLKEDLENLINLILDESKEYKLGDGVGQSQKVEINFTDFEPTFTAISNKTKILNKALSYTADNGDEVSTIYYAISELNTVVQQIKMSFLCTDMYLYWLEYIRNWDDTEDFKFNATTLKVGEQLQAALGNLDQSKSELDVNISPIKMLTVSATLKMNGRFDEFKDLIGNDVAVSKYESYDAGTVFDYKKQGLLYIPSDCPSVKNDREGHLQFFKDEVCKLIEASNGGALILTTTSYEARDLHNYLKLNFKGKYKIISYEDSSNKIKLVEEFKNDRNSILIGTRGFFQGIDVPGDSLRLVCINKIPFPSPDLISKAKGEILKSEGKNDFNLLSVYPATQTMLQAIGRLIRHTSDKGVVAIFDDRLTSGLRWIQPIVRSLPDFTRTQSLEDVKDFFDNLQRS